MRTKKGTAAAFVLVFAAVAATAATAIATTTTPLKANDNKAEVIEYYSMHDDEGNRHIYNEKDAPKGAEPFAKLIRNGRYEMTDEDDGFLMCLSDAQVVSDEEGYVFGGFLLAGDSKVICDDYSVFSYQKECPSFTSVKATGDEFYDFFSGVIDKNDSLNYEITGYYDRNLSCKELIVDEGATLRIKTQTDPATGADYGGVVWADRVNCFGTIAIEDSKEGAEPNFLRIEDGGDIFVGDRAKVTGKGDAKLIIQKLGVSSNLELYAWGCGRYDPIDAKKTVKDEEFRYLNGKWVTDRNWLWIENNGTYSKYLMTDDPDSVSDQSKLRPFDSEIEKISVRDASFFEYCVLGFKGRHQIFPRGVILRTYDPDGKIVEEKIMPITEDEQIVLGHRNDDNGRPFTYGIEVVTTGTMVFDGHYRVDVYGNCGYEGPVPFVVQDVSTGSGSFKLAINPYKVEILDNRGAVVPFEKKTNGQYVWSMEKDKGYFVKVYAVEELFNVMKDPDRRFIMVSIEGEEFGTFKFPVSKNIEERYVSGNTRIYELKGKTKDARVTIVPNRGCLVKVTSAGVDVTDRIEEGVLDWPFDDMVLNVRFEYYPAAVKDEQIIRFVERIYENVLDREPEHDGVMFWSSEIFDFKRTGAEVAMNFIFSDEFKARGTSDADFVSILYRTFFGREPEQGGFEFWTGALANGSMDRMDVASGFIYSQEWANICASYGILSGTPVRADVRIKPSEDILAFVDRLYLLAFDREADIEGRAYWADQLANFDVTGEQAGLFFFMSDEMQAQEVPDGLFINRVYRTFMDRFADTQGVNFWGDFLLGGGTREEVVRNFLRSEEFCNKCYDSRILPY